MPHIRKRYLQKKIEKWLGYSPLVGVLGHRQVGKTTLLDLLGSSYHTLDVLKERLLAEQDPETYVKNRAGKKVVIDECQMVPELFPALKEWVRTHKKPGQFLLSGSVRFTSREAIRESLTGRIVNLELLPFSVTELEGMELSDFVPRLLKVQDLFMFHAQEHYRSKSVSEKLSRRTQQYFEQGGLPGICFLRDEQLRTLKIKEQLETILDRDLRMVRKVQLSLRDIKAVLESLSQLNTVGMDLSRIRRESGASLPTIKKLLYCLEATYLIRQIPVEGSFRSMSCFFEDMGEHRSLLKEEPKLMNQLTHFIFTQWRTQFEYRLEEETHIFQYKTRGGAYIPLAFRNKEGVLGMIPIEHSDQVTQVLGSANSFLKTYSKSKIVIVHFDSAAPRVVQNRIISLPLGHTL